MEKPTIPKGTRDFGPGQMAKRQYILNTISSIYRKYGFLPLETPAIENLSTLTGKYGDEGDQLLFRILNSGDFLQAIQPDQLIQKNSKQLSPAIAEKGLRYDLTVPFARFVVMNRHEITFPFKRYQMQPVWRADRPQKGRYREFYQCDADVVGTDSLLCEAEILLMIKEVANELGLMDYTTKINHRAILEGLASLAGANGQESSLYVAIDKLDKIGEIKVKEELLSRGFPQTGIESLFDILNFKGSNLDKIKLLESKLQNTSSGSKGIGDLKEVLSLLKSYQFSEDHLEIDLTLARGLSYYTGCIFEVKINNISIGSVGGGGRYDNLTGVFGLSGISGVGFSFGIDRLYDALEELHLFPKDSQRSSQVMLAHFDKETLHYAMMIAANLRNRGIATEVYPDLSKLKKQLDYAHKKMVPFVIVVGSEEMKSNLLTVKLMDTGEQKSLLLDEVYSLIHKDKIQ